MSEHNVIDIRPYGRGRIVVYLEAGHPALKRLRRRALFAVKYHKAGAVVGYDLCFPADQAERLQAELEQG